MRNSHTILLLISIICSCTFQDKQIVGQQTQDSKTLDTIVPFSGFWINEVYVKCINKSKSPRKCQDMKESCITIPQRTLQATTMVFGLHEGGSEIVVVKNDSGFQFNYKYDDTVRDKAYDIQVISEDKIRIGKNIFLKSDEKFLQQLLFIGAYVDSLGNKIEFLKDGRIIGLDTFAFYDPIYDYVGPGNEVDQLVMGRKAEKMTPYGFQFKQDTLLIYNLACLIFDSTNNSCDQVDFGDIKYRLVKIH